MGTWVVEVASNDGLDAAPRVMAVAGDPIIDFGGDGPVALCEYDGCVRLGDVPNGSFLDPGGCWYEAAVDEVLALGGCDQQPWLR